MRPRTSLGMAIVLLMGGCATNGPKYRSTVTNAELSKRLIDESLLAMKIACESGTASSCTSLAELYSVEKQFVEELRTDHDLAARYAKRACESGQPRGCLLQAQFLARSDVRAWEALVTTACQGGDGSACKILETAGDLTTGAVPPEIRVEATLEREVIRRIVAESREERWLCYSSKLADDPDLRGTVVANYAIDSGGNVDLITSTSETDMPDSAVTECVLEVLKRGKYPPPNLGGHVFVRYPFAFSPP